MKLVRPFSFRCFSTIKTKIPESASDFFRQNKSLVERTFTKTEIENLSQLLFSDLASKKDSESKKFISSATAFRYEANISAIFFEGLKDFDLEDNKKHSLITLSNLIAAFAGYKFRNYVDILDPIRNEDQRLPQILYPHIDDYSNNLDMLTLIGLDAPYKNYRTYIIEAQDVVAALDEKTKMILQEKIFFIPEEKDIFWSVLSQNQNLFRIRFDSNYRAEDAESICLWNLSKAKNKIITNDDVKEALAKIKTVIMSIYEKGNLESFYVGSNDILFIKNGPALHGRDQEGVLEQDLKKERNLGSCGYEIADFEFKNLVEESKTQIKNSGQKHGKTILE
ncbi:MAG: hypothetical protein SFV53_06025 [Rickettsiales bacterium]|nr:hypothetical protein [Rickettsiales bacterium]